MRIFNEDLKKYLSDNKSLNDLDDFIFAFKWWAINLLIIYLLMTIIGDFVNYGDYILHINENIFKVSMFIYFMLSIFLYFFILDKRYKKQLQENAPPNPIIEKLKNIYKNNKSLNSDDLINIWNEYNSIFNANELHPSQNNDVVLLSHKNEEQSNSENIKLFQKLDDDLVHFIENADDITIKLFNLENFDSYQQLYMKYIAPKEKGYLIRKIKRLLTSLSNTNNSQENHIIQQLNELKNEIEKYDIETKDYFEFKKWNDGTWKMLKLDNNNDMVQNQYQEIMQKING